MNNNDSGLHAEIMRTALEKYLGSEEQWCAGAQARTVNGESLSDVLHPEARSYCAEGAITAATWEVMTRQHPGDRWFSPTFGLPALTLLVFKGVERVLVEQYPEFVAAVVKAGGALVFTHGATVALFNDGVVSQLVEYDGIGLVKTVTPIPGVGYTGIRAAFEKYLAQCEEQGL